MNYRWGCQDLKNPDWKTTLDDIVDKARAGVEVKWGDHGLRATKALLRRYYLEEYSEVRRSSAGHDYVQFLLRPSRKALALWVDLESPHFGGQGPHRYERGVCVYCGHRDGS